jgi:hypothetical protein
MAPQGQKNKTAVRFRGSGQNYLFLCRFFLSFFLRLWVAIFLSLRFLPQGTRTPSFLLWSRNIPQLYPEPSKKVKCPEEKSGIPNSKDTGAFFGVPAAPGRQKTGLSAPIPQARVRA